VGIAPLKSYLDLRIAAVINLGKDIKDFHTTKKNCTFAANKFNSL
jgi:hypothetical protein